MQYQDLHTHSLYDDGKSSLRQMAQGAVQAGLSAIGFSIHSPLPFETSWAAKEADLPQFLREAEGLRQEMKDRINIYIGIELDALSQIDLAPFDYVIGSVHHIECGETYQSVDKSPETTRQILSCFGSPDQMAQAYFAQYEELAKNPCVDVIGHIDLLTKFQELDPVFDPLSAAYLAVAEDAMEKLVAADKIFEINTGAISRGYRTSPYPSEALLRRLSAMGGKITLNSDAHSADSLGHCYAESVQLAKRCGFTALWQFDGKTFIPVPI